MFKTILFCVKLIGTIAAHITTLNRELIFLSVTRADTSRLPKSSQKSQKLSFVIREFFVTPSVSEVITTRQFNTSIYVTPREEEVWRHFWPTRLSLCHVTPREEEAWRHFGLFQTFPNSLPISSPSTSLRNLSGLHLDLLFVVITFRQVNLFYNWYFKEEVNSYFT